LVRPLIPGLSNRPGLAGLHSVIGYATPKYKLTGKDQKVLEVRDEKLAAARAERKRKRLKEEVSRPQIMPEALV